MGHWLPLSWLPQEINDTSNTSQTSCDNYGWPTQTAASSPSQWWVTLSKEVMVRNLRGGQNFCLVWVTHPALWTTVPLALPGKEMLLQGSPQKPEGKLFLALSEAKELSEPDIKQSVYTVQAYWWAKHAQGSTCKVESAGPTSSAASQGIPRLLPVTNLFTTWRWTNGKLVPSPVLIRTCNGSISDSGKLHLPQMWMKITLSVQSWQAKWKLTSSYTEEKLLFNSVNGHGEDQGAGTGKHPLHSDGQCVSEHTARARSEI